MPCPILRRPSPDISLNPIQQMLAHFVIEFGLSTFEISAKWFLYFAGIVLWFKKMNIEIMA